MRSRIILLALSVAIAIPVLAQQSQQAKPGSSNPRLVTAGSYTADPNHTLVEWNVDHMGFTPYFGLVGQITGKLALDPKNLSAAKVDVTIPVSKVTTALPALAEHLLRAPAVSGGKPDFFGPSPANATFRSTTVVPTGGMRAKVTGDLTLNGVTKPVTLDVTFYGAGKAPAEMGGRDYLGFTGAGVIRRSDFGLAFLVPVVSDEVTLKISAGFMKE